MSHMSVCLGPSRALLYGLGETAHHPAALLERPPLSDQCTESLGTSRTQFAIVMHGDSSCLRGFLFTPQESCAWAAQSCLQADA